MNNKDFAHLHVHGEFSTLDGYGSSVQYAERAKEMGFKHLALTDHGSVDGTIKHQHACAASDIHSILGCEAYMVPNCTIKEKGEKKYHITLIAKNMTGWTNLLKLTSCANINGFYRKPRIDPELLLEHADGIIVMTACASGFMKMPGADDLLLKLNEATDVFLEIMPIKMKMQDEMTEICIQANKKTGIPLVATNDCHYILQEHAKLQEVLLAMQSKAKWKDPKRWKFDVTGLYLKSADEMIETFSRDTKVPADIAEEAIRNTIQVAELCDLFVEKVPVVLPKVHVPQYDGLPDYEQLTQLSLDGLEEKAAKHPWVAEDMDTYYERVQHELELIISLGYSTYFLIVWELIAWCKDNDIMTGPGRGSVGGCLVAWLLKITAVDPLKYNLVFSRFISEGRIDLPDIDMDFEDAKRGQIREHLEDLYGEFNVIGLTTFAKMHGRGALRDVSRVFDVPLVEVNKAAKAVVVRSGGDLRSDFTIEDTFKAFEDGRAFFKKYPEVSKFAMALEGQNKAHGKHAAAVCVTDVDLRSGANAAYAMRSKELVCNWDKYDSEYMGLMKLDVLGLNALTVLSNCRKLILDRNGVDIDFDLIPLDDEVVYKEFTAGNNIGVFQFNSLGMMKLCTEIWVEDFEMLVAMNALHRPGCLRSGMVHEFNLRKHGKKPIPKVHEYISKITKDTYGIILYQEQVMHLMYDLGGLPWKTADTIRKVMSKSQGVEQFNTFEKKFMDGCKEKGTLSEKEAQTVFGELKYFGSYGFNKAHSVEYALIAYWDMWLKVHYPVEFMLSLLSHGPDDKKKDFIAEARRLGMNVLLPDINTSKVTEWTVDKTNKNLLVPFCEVKGIGPTAAKKIVKERDARGPYKGLDDLDARTPSRQVNKTVKERLQSVMAFDELENKVELSEERLDELSEFFAFDLSNDPMYRYRKMADRIMESIDIKPISSVVANEKSKDTNFYFGQMTVLKFGYKEKSDGHKLTDARGVASDLGGVYGNLKDDDDFIMLVFGSKFYSTHQYEIEHCEGQWLLVSANRPYNQTALLTNQLWFGDDLLAGKANGLRLQLAKPNTAKVNPDVSKCTGCQLRDECNGPVRPTAGSTNAMIVGEAPGKDEDRVGAGFVGSSGKMLFKEIEARGFRREDFWISNVTKCFPSKTKTPKKTHMAACSKWLDEELKAVKPFIVLAFGNASMKFFKDRDSGIMDMSGKTEWNEKYGCWITFCIHPASVLYHAENKPMLQEALDEFAEKFALLGYGIDA